MADVGVALPSKDDTVLETEIVHENLPTRLVKLRNRIKHMEYNIDQNRTRGESLCRDCYALFRSTELLAFDFVFASYLLGHGESEDVYDFLERSICPKYDLSAADPVGFTKANEHFQYLQSVIRKCSKTILADVRQRPNIPKTSEFVLYLKTRKRELELELAREARAKDALPQETPEILVVDDERMMTEDLPAAFSTWLERELKIGREQDEESIQLRCLIGSVARRLATIKNLNDTIQNMKKETLSVEDLDYTDCVPEDLYMSPFFVGVKKSCGFLMTVFDALDSQKDVFVRCREAMHQCSEKLVSATVEAERTIENMRSHIEGIQRTVEAKQKEADALKEEVKQIVTRTNPVLPAVPDKSARYAESEARLKRELVAAGDDAEKTAKIEAQLIMLAECKTGHAEITELCANRNAKIARIVESDESIIGLVLDQCRAEDELMMHDAELEQQQKYEEAMKDVFESLRVHEMNSWCDELGGITANFGKTDAQHAILDKLRSIGDNREVELQAAAKRREIKELSERNYAICVAIGKAKLELDNLLDEQARAQQTLDLYSDWTPPYVDRNNQAQMQEYRKMAICPVCNRNRRDCILATCGHAMCSACLEKSNTQCPVCNTGFVLDKDVKPFLLQ